MKNILTLEAHLVWFSPLNCLKNLKNYSFTVILYPSIEAKALGLPNIFGKFNLRAITKSFKIVR